MIQGEVVFHEGFQAEIPLVMSGTEGRSEAVVAVIDTGFERDLTLPREIVHRLGLPPKGLSQVLLAGDQEMDLESFYGMVESDGERLEVDVYQMEGQPLVGMRLLVGCRLSIHVTVGGKVTVERI